MVGCAVLSYRLQNLLKIAKYRTQPFSAIPYVQAGAGQTTPEATEGRAQWLSFPPTPFALRMKPDKAILCMSVGLVFTWAGLYYIFPALLIHWEQSLGWSKAELTSGITLSVLISAVAAWPAGRMIDRGQGPQLIIGGTLLGCAALFACSFVQHLWQFLILWSILGVSFAGCLYEPCFAIVTRSRGPRARQAIILITLIAGFAGSVSFPSAHLLAEYFGWRHTLRVMAGAVALVGAPALWYGARILEARSSTVTGFREVIQKREETRHQIGSPVFWLLGVSFALLAILHGVILHHLLPMLHGRGVTPELAILVVSLIGPMQVVGRLIMVAVGRYASNHRISMATFAFMGLSVVMLMWADHHPVRLVLFVICFGSSYGIVSIIRPLITRDLMGESGFGAKSGGLAFLYLCGRASAPFLGSLVWQFGGYPLVLPLLACLAGIGLSLYLAAHWLVAYA